MEAKCSKCRVQACDVPPGTKPYPSFCPMAQDSDALPRARDEYDDETTLAFARAAAQTEAAGYCKDTRIEEIVKFARRLGYRKLGIANCIGLLREAKILQEVFEANGF